MQKNAVFGGYTGASERPASRRTCNIIHGGSRNARDDGRCNRRDVSALIAEILSCSSFHEVDERILRPLALALDCTSAYLAQIGSCCLDDKTQIERSAFIGPSQSAVDAYAAGEFRRCPLLTAEPNRLRSMYRMERDLKRGTTDAVGQESIRYWREWLTRQGQIGDNLGIAVPVRTSIGPRLVALMFHRGNRAEPFDDESMELLNDAIPALRAVLGNLVMAEAACVANQIMSALADTNAVGFVLFDKAMKIRYANERGMQAIADGASPPAGTDDTRVASLSNGAGETFRLSMTTRASPSKSVDHLRRAYRLTAREIEVVKTITEGHSNSSAARQLGIALRTMENHLRSVYLKMGIGTRTQLVSRAVGTN